MPDSIIRVENVSKAFELPHEKHGSVKSIFLNMFKKKSGYEKQLVLKDISFEIKEGDFFGIVGRNGSGKSTLLKLLAGIYNPNEGEIHVAGKLTPFIELGVGFNPELSGRDNIFLNGALLGFNRSEVEGMYDDIVEFAELERFMDQKLKNYSSGMQVRLAFSIAIRAQSDILLLDEVLAVGDAAFQQKCFNYFEELKEQKKTVVFVSHDMEAVQRFCTSAIYIDKGVLTHSGAPSEIAEEYLEKNMESMRKNDAKKEDTNTLSKNHSLSAKIIEETKERVAIEFSYQSEKDDVYVGISVIKDGISIAEITTSQTETLKGRGKIVYNLDTTAFNAGIYQIGAGLFRARNRELLSIVKNKIQFTVKGSDPSKGGALKLADTWKYN